MTSLLKPILIRKMPPEIYKIVLKEQNRIKELKGVAQFSLDRTILGIIKEWSELKNKIA